MSRLGNAVTGVVALVGALRSEISTLRDKGTGDLDQAGQDALADRLEALLSQAEPVVSEETGDGEELDGQPVVEQPLTGVQPEPQASAETTTETATETVTSNELVATGDSTLSDSAATGSGEQP